MKLRNKQTGEIGEIRYENHALYVDTDEGFTYWLMNIAKLNEEWEDYYPKEPFIKDEKLRKAVRAWADANRISECTCKDEIHCITFETERGMFISFENADPVPAEGNFSITELCGDEE